MINDGPLTADRKVSLSKIEELTKRIDVTPGDEISVFLETISDDPTPRSALIAIRFEDSAGNALEIPEWNSVSPAVGEYHYLGSSDEIAVTTFGLVAPPESSALNLQGIQWKKNVETSFLDDVIVVRHGIDSYPAALPSGNVIPIPIAEFSQKISIPSDSSEISISGSAKLPGDKSSALLKVAFLDENREKMMPPGHLPQNPVHGPFFQIKGEQGPVEFEFTVMPPLGARNIHVSGASWGDTEVTVSGPLTASPVTSGQVDIQGFLNDIPDGAPLIVIDTTAPPMGDDTRALRPNNLAKAFARKGAWVIFLPFSSIQEYEARFSEKILQVPRSDYGKLVELLVSKRDARISTYISSSFPSLASVTLATRLKNRGWTVVYEARDDMEEFNRVGYSKWYAPSLERQMLTIADKVVSVSIGLDEKLVSMWPSIPDHVVIPNAVNRAVIDASADLRAPEQFSQRESSRVVGYVGHLTPAWFDWPAVIAAAKRLPNVEFQIIGHGAPENLNAPSNISILGPKTHEELAAIVPDWKVGLIPFLDIPLTRSVDPNKIYEYFAWGLRCVTAPMGSVETYPSTYVYRGADQLVEQLRRAIEQPYTEHEITELESMVQQCDWDNRASQCLNFYGVEMELPIYA